MEHCLATVLALLAPGGAFTATLLSEPLRIPISHRRHLVGCSHTRQTNAGAHRRTHNARRQSSFRSRTATCAVLARVCGRLPPERPIARRRSTTPRARTVLDRRRRGATGRFAPQLSPCGPPPPGDLLNGRIGDMAAWFAVNSFVLAIAAGWVIVPGAILGLTRLFGRGELARPFVALTAMLTGGCLIEAAAWSARGQGAYERFAIYPVPLLAIGFVAWLESGSARRLFFSSFAYAMAIAAVIVPLASSLRTESANSPTLTALATLGPGSGTAVWAPLLAVLAAGLGLIGAVKTKPGRDRRNLRRLRSRDHHRPHLHPVRLASFTSRVSPRQRAPPSSRFRAMILPR